MATEVKPHAQIATSSMGCHRVKSPRLRTLNDIASQSLELLYARTLCLFRVALIALCRASAVWARRSASVSGALAAGALA